MNPFRGYKVCPRWLHDCYRRSAQYKCQRCGRREHEVGKLIPHRIKRSNKGGLYTVYKLNDKRNNIKICCKECHKKFHQNDNRRIRCN